LGACAGVAPALVMSPRKAAPATGVTVRALIRSLRFNVGRFCN
jgi:hypothetical protein